MKRYTLSGADSFKHVPEHPERTAKRQHGGLNFDMTFQVWPNRAAMLKTIEMQERREHRFDDWMPCICGSESDDGHGYLVLCQLRPGHDGPHFQR